MIEVSNISRRVELPGHLRLAKGVKVTLCYTFTERPHDFELFVLVTKGDKTRVFDADTVIQPTELSFPAPSSKAVQNLVAKRHLSPAQAADVIALKRLIREWTFSFEEATADGPERFYFERPRKSEVTASPQTTQSMHEFFVEGPEPDEGTELSVEEEQEDLRRSGT